MAERCKYLKKATAFVVAVQLDLETDGFTYEKWRGTQTCKPGDWLVDNDGDVYTVDRDTFARTYRPKPKSPGVYRKTTPVWAEIAERDGHILTREGVTHYVAGDYIVYNDPEGKDGYAVSADSFKEMYEPAC